MTYKVFIGLTEIAGYCGNLKRGFHSIGIECTFINLSSHPFQYGGDDEPNILVKMCRWSLKHVRNYNSKILKAPFFLLVNIVKVAIFVRALHHYNVFIFVFGNSFFNNFDLPIMKLLNKQIIFIYLGSDDRPPYIDGFLKDITPIMCKTRAQKIKSSIVAKEKYASSIIAHPASAHFHVKKCIKGLSIGLPLSAPTHKESPQTEIKTKKSVVILHSPSDPTAKGSNLIRAAISELIQKGHSIDFVEITGKPHSEVIKELQDCDFVVDQVYSDTPMATFATEAAWFGKPAVVGGYYSKFIENEYAQKDIPPSIFCHPDELSTAIERLIVDEEYRLDLGTKAQKFVRTKWTPEQVAKRYLQVIEGAAPEEFTFDPNQIRYVQGGGMPESQSKEIIRNMIEQYSIESLCLSDKPELEQRFREYAYNIRK